MRIALTIAGSDPTGAAGLEADLRVFQCFGLHGAALATALTVQDSRRVHEVVAVDPSLFARRLDVLLADFRPDVVKLGMLADAAIARILVPRLGALADSGIPIVVDPVLVSSSGATLLEAEGLEVLRREILPRAFAVCPNRAEAAALLGREDDPARMAAALGGLGPRIVVVTGGDADEPSARDFVFSDGRSSLLDGPRIEGWSPHGTGCTFASALAAAIVTVGDPLRALALAKTFTFAAISRAACASGSRGRPLPRLDGARDGG